MLFRLIYLRKINITSIALSICYRQYVCNSVKISSSQMSNVMNTCNMGVEMFLEKTCILFIKKLLEILVHQILMDFSERWLKITRDGNWNIPPWRPSVPPAALHGLNASLTGDYILYSPAPTAPGLCLTFGQFDKIHLLPEGGILQLVYCRYNRLTYYCILEFNKYYFVIYENILRWTKNVIYFIICMYKYLMCKGIDFRKGGL